MIKFNKYLVCRWGITIVGLVGIVSMCYYLPMIISTVSDFFGNPTTSNVINMVLWTLVYTISVVTINTIWYALKRTPEKDLKDSIESLHPLLFILVFFGLVIVGVSICIILLSYVPGTTPADLCNEIKLSGTPLLVVIGLNVFIIVFYESVAKKACKLIYKGGE